MTFRKDTMLQYEEVKRSSADLARHKKIYGKNLSDSFVFDRREELQKRCRADKTRLTALVYRDLEAQANRDKVNKIVKEIEDV